jgi:hypothetical protein
MFTSRVFNVLIAIALVIVVALTTREVLATAKVLARADASGDLNAPRCAILPPQLSIETVYDQQRGMWVSHTTQGHTGVDGGLMSLIATYPTCSR